MRSATWEPALVIALLASGCADRERAVRVSAPAASAQPQSATAPRAPNTAGGTLARPPRAIETH